MYAPVVIDIVTYFYPVGNTSAVHLTRKLPSEPTELTGEFREESDYTNVISHIEKGIANDTRTRQRNL